jgi:hypothetical protein
MKVVATEVAFYDGHLVRVGDELDVPEGTRGKWFALAGTREADRALIKAEAEKPDPWERRAVEIRKPETNPLDYNPYAGF